MPELPLNCANVSLKNYVQNAPLNAHQKARYKFITDLLKQIPARGKGLDYGCGLGDITNHVAKLFDSIIGVDVSEERVEWANAQYPPIKFQVCDSTTLDFPDGSFNTVLSSVVINWADSPDLYLKNIHNVLVTGGHLVIIVRGTDRLRTGIRSMLGKRTRMVAGCKNISVETMKTMLAPNFRIVRTTSLYAKLEETPKRPNEILLYLIKLPFRLFKAPSYAEYYGILAQKIS